ncbi:MAG: hypothetical protein M1816_001826 [Peltula sp. TS41687]|nr:MAG: hypothetical protein M1816_001826 [Peltula sp. TS41687]
MRRLVIFSLITTLLIATIISAAPTGPQDPTTGVVFRKLDRTTPYRPTEITSTDLGSLAKDLNLDEFGRTRQWKLRKSYQTKQGDLLADLRQEHPDRWPSESTMEAKRRGLREHLETEIATARRNQKHRGGQTPQQKMVTRIEAKRRELDKAHEKVSGFEERSKMWAARAAGLAEVVKKLEEELETLRYPRGRPADNDGQVVEQEKGGGGGGGARDVNHSEDPTITATTTINDDGASKRAQSQKKNNNQFFSLRSFPSAQQAGKFIGDRVDSLMRSAGNVLQQPSVKAPPGPLLGPVPMPAGGGIYGY